MIKKTYTGLILSLYIWSPAFGQVLQKPLLTSAGAGVYSSTHRDLFSGMQNPAALATLRHTTAGMYNERRFMLQGMNYVLAATGIPSAIAAGSFGARIFYSGIKEYNQSGLGITYGRQLNDMADAGIGFQYHRIDMQEYGAVSAIGVECGLIARLTGKLYSGIYIANPAGGRFGKNTGLKLPSVFAMGMGFEASGHFFTSIEVVKEEGQPVNMNACLLYKFHSRCRAGVGIASATASVWSSVSLQMKLCRVEMVAGYHPVLGVSPAILLLYEFKKQHYEKPAALD